MEKATKEDLHRSASFIREHFQLIGATHWVAHRAELKEMEDEEEEESEPIGHPDTMSTLSGHRAPTGGHAETEVNRGGSQVINKRHVITQKLIKIELKIQGPWLIMRIYDRDGCRFRDHFVDRILIEDDGATTSDGQPLDDDHSSVGEKIRG